MQELLKEVELVVETLVLLEDVVEEGLVLLELEVGVLEGFEEVGGAGARELLLEGGVGEGSDGQGVVEDLGEEHVFFGVERGRWGGVGGEVFVHRVGEMGINYG